MLMPKRLGEVLNTARRILPDQLVRALRLEKRQMGHLGRILDRLGHAGKQDLVPGLADQAGFPRFDINQLHLDMELLGTNPEDFFRREKFVPVRREGNVLSVALTDPLNVVLLNDLRTRYGCEIEPLIATESQLEQALKRYYGFCGLLGAAAAATAQEEMIIAGGNEIDVPVIRMVNTIFRQAVGSHASDIHVEPYQDALRIRFRVDGMLRDVMNLSKQIHPSFISRIKIMADMNIAEKRIPQDGRMQFKSGTKTVDLRVSSLPTIFGEKVVVRVLDRAAMKINLEDLGFREATLMCFRSLIKRSFGAILVTGPTGSGKTSTLYAAINDINTPEKNIITIEDPVEFILEGINQTPVNFKAGLTFASGLRSILRQDPDVIGVGEIRDAETADIAVRAATTGHLVLSTMHTNDAAGALTRLVDMGVEPFLVASSVIGVVAQRLVRRLCPHCRVAYPVPSGAPERMFMGLNHDPVLTLFRGRGCARCGNTGYHGRIAIQEVMPVTTRHRELILSKAPAESIKEVSVAAGMVTLKVDGIQKAVDGITSIEEVMRVASFAED